MLIGILQTGQAPDTLMGSLGDYPDLFSHMLRDKGLTFKTWHVEAGIFPSGVHDADGWLITGSRHGAYEPHDFIPPLEAFIRDAYAQKVPLVGICFGHQIIAQALGGKVEKFDKGWAVGPQTYDFDGETVVLQAWHQDQVVKKPENATCVASNPFCEYAALVYDDRAFTVQAHPEFGDSFVDGLIRTRGRGKVPDPLLDAAAARLGGPLDNAGMADRIAAFFKLPRDTA
jgi:GMP synthase-like glutamine amidotransferase